MNAKGSSGDYIEDVALDRLMREEIENKLLGLIDHYEMWSSMVDLTSNYMEKQEWCPDREMYVKPRGSPGKITTGLRDLLLMMEMHHAQAEGRGTKKAADKLAGEWQKIGLWSDSGKSLRRYFLRMCRSGPTMSMARTASELIRLRQPGK